MLFYTGRKFKHTSDVQKASNTSSERFMNVQLSSGGSAKYEQNVFSLEYCG